MTTSATTPVEENSDTDEVMKSGTVPLCVADMVTGRTLQFPVYDEQGVLLLAGGSIITPRFKQLLQRREVDKIQASAVDAANLTAPDSVDLDDCVADLEQFAATHELSSKLDSLIESGSLFVKNIGPPASRNIVLHGCSGYNAEARKKVEDRHHASARALDGMMRHAINGGEGASEQIAVMAGHFLTSMTSDIDMVLALAAEAGGDEDLSQHCLQMATLGMAIAVEMGYDAENVQRVGMCGLVHDWGMLRVPEEIRSKTRRLTPVEFHDIKKHPIYSLEMLRGIVGLPGVIPLTCYQVHERPNGSGYPRGRQGNSIHPFARILHVADIYVALTSRRSYRAPLMPHAAMECLLSKAAVGTVDHEVVQKLLMSLTLYPPGSLVELSDQSVAQSLRRNGSRYSQPIVRIVRLPDGKKAPHDDSQVLDLADSDLRITRPIPFPGRNEIPLTTEIFEADEH